MVNKMTQKGNNLWKCLRKESRENRSTTLLLYVKMNTSHVKSFVHSFKLSVPVHPFCINLSCVLPKKQRTCGAQNSWKMCSCSKTATLSLFWCACSWLTSYIFIVLLYCPHTLPLICFHLYSFFFIFIPYSKFCPFCLDFCFTTF